MTSTNTSTTTNEHEHLVSCLDAAEDLLQEIEQACGIETTMRASFDQVKAHAAAMAARIRELEAQVQEDRSLILDLETAIHQMGEVARQRHNPTFYTHQIIADIRANRDRGGSPGGLPHDGSDGR